MAGTSPAMTSKVVFDSVPESVISAARLRARLSGLRWPAKEEGKERTLRCNVITARRRRGDLGRRLGFRRRRRRLDHHPLALDGCDCAAVDTVDVTPGLQLSALVHECALVGHVHPDLGRLY